MPSKRGIVVAPMSVGDILQNTTSVTIGANVLGRILFATPTVQKLLGYSPEELMGKPVTMLMPERFKPMHEKGFQKWLQSEKLYHEGKELKVSGRHKDGREIPISLTIGSYYDGPDLRAVATIKDVREIIVLEEATEMMRQELNQTRAITENIGIGIITTDINGIIMSMNPMAEMMLGYLEDETVGRSGHELLHRYNPDGSIEKIEDCEIMKTLDLKKVKMVLDDYFTTKEGKFLNIDLTIAPIMRDDLIHGLVISFTDISDRKQRELALKESELRYKSLVEFSPDPIIVYSGGVFIYANKAGLKMVGATSEDQVLGKPVLGFIHPDYHEIVIERMKEVMVEGKQTAPLYEKVLRLDGSPIDVEIASMPIIYNGGASALAIIRDITERIMDEKRYELITQTSTDMIAMTGLDGRIIFANHPAHEVTLGYGKDELVGTLLRDLIHPDQRSTKEQEEENVARLRRGERLPATKTRMRHKNGHYVWVEGTGALLTQGRDSIYFLSTVHDITALVEREKNIQLFVDALPVMAWTAHPDGYIYWYNDNWYKYTGQTSEDASDGGWQSVHHPDYIEAVKDRWDHSIKTGEPFEMEFPLRAKDGIYHWFLTRVNPIVEDGVIIRWVGTNTNIDEARKAYEYKAELAAIIESSHSAIIGKTLNGIITSWNPAAESMYGYTAEEAIGQKIEFIVPDDKKDELVHLMLQVCRGERVVNLRTVRVTKSGQRIKITLVVSPIKDIDGNLIGASAIASPDTGE